MLILFSISLNCSCFVFFSLIRGAEMKQEQNHILENKSPHGGHTLHHNCCWYSLLTLNYGERAQCEVLPAAEAWQKKKIHRA